MALASFQLPRASDGGSLSGENLLACHGMLVLRGLAASLQTLSGDLVLVFCDFLIIFPAFHFQCLFCFLFHCLIHEYLSDWKVAVHELYLQAHRIHWSAYFPSVCRQTHFEPLVVGEEQGQHPQIDRCLPGNSGIRSIKTPRC